MTSDEEEKNEVQRPLLGPSKNEFIINPIRNNGFFSGYLRTFAISPDSTRVIVRTTPYSIDIIDLESKKPIERLDSLQTTTLSALAIAPNQKYFVIGSNDYLRLINYQDLSTIHTFNEVHEGVIRNIDISPDSRYIATSSNDNKIKIFDFEAMKLINTLSVHEGQLDSNSSYTMFAKFAPNSKYIASVASDCNLKVSSYLEGSQVLNSYEDLHSIAITALCISPCSQLIYTGARDTEIKVVEAMNQKVIHTFPNVHSNWITALNISSDGNCLVSASLDRSVKIIDTKSLQIVKSLDLIHQSGITWLQFSPNQKLLLTSSADKSLRVFDVPTFASNYWFRSIHAGAINQVVLSSDENFIVAVSDDHSVSVSDTKTFEVVQKYENVHQQWIISLDISSDSSFIVTGSYDNTIRIIDLKKKLIEEGPTQHVSVDFLKITPDSKLLIAGLRDGVVTLIDLQRKRSMHRILFCEKKRMKDIAISPNNKWMALSPKYKGVTVFSLQTKRALFSLPGVHSKIVFSHCNRFIVTCGLKTSVKVFDIYKRCILHKFYSLHSSFIYALDISIDGNYLVTGAKDKKIKIIDLAKKEVCCTISTFEIVRTLKVFKNSKSIVYGTEKGSVNVVKFP